LHVGVFSKIYPGWLARMKKLTMMLIYNSNFALEPQIECFKMNAYEFTKVPKELI